MGSSAPFCPWKHPELDKKETFYFAGHYLGSVNPANYALCFPLKPQLSISYWFQYLISKIRYLINPSMRKESPDSIESFFTFDGCAQYLTSPTAPFLIAEVCCLFFLCFFVHYILIIVAINFIYGVCIYIYKLLLIEYRLMHFEACHHQF